MDGKNFHTSKRGTSARDGNLTKNVLNKSALLASGLGANVTQKAILFQEFS